MASRFISATEFKAKCLALLDEIEHGDTITVTKRGRPVAVLSPPKRKPFKWPGNSWAKKGRIVGDIVNSDPNIWDVVSK
jgi:prevent-host-death family protein